MSNHAKLSKSNYTETKNNKSIADKVRELRYYFTFIFSFNLKYRMSGKSFSLDHLIGNFKGNKIEEHSTKIIVSIFHEKYFLKNNECKEERKILEDKI